MCQLHWNKFNNLFIIIMNFSLSIIRKITLHVSDFFIPLIFYILKFTTRKVDLTIGRTYSYKSDSKHKAKLDSTALEFM